MRSAITRRHNAIGRADDGAEHRRDLEHDAQSELEVPAQEPGHAHHGLRSCSGSRGASCRDPPPRSAACSSPPPAGRRRRPTRAPPSSAEPGSRAADELGLVVCAAAGPTIATSDSTCRRNWPGGRIGFEYYSAPRAPSRPATGLGERSSCLSAIVTGDVPGPGSAVCYPPMSLAEDEACSGTTGVDWS